jgi:hypothetical protein
VFLFFVAGGSLDLFELRPAARLRAGGDRLLLFGPVTSQ